MKFLKNLVFYFLLTLFAGSFLYSQNSVQNKIPEGIELCNELYSYFKKNKINPEIQNLVSSGENKFPYNILINNFQQNNDATVEDDCLIFAFTTEDAWQYKDLITKVYFKLKDQPFNSTILILYGENDFYPNFHQINSSKVFINSLDLNDNNILYNFRFNQKSNNIISGTRGYTSPSWMVHQIVDILNESQIDFKFPFLYISQLAKFKFESDRILSTFLQNDISAISLCYSEDVPSENNLHLVFDKIIDDFENSKNSEKDYHSLMLKIGTFSLWLPEIAIIKILIFIVLISLGFIFILGYVNIQLKNSTWVELKNNWYTLIATYILSVIAFLIGKGFYLLTAGNNFSNRSVYGIIVLQLIITITFLSAFYFLEQYFNKKMYTGKSIDLLILLITFINQFIFCFIDISLFPIFMTICILSIFSLLFNKNWSHLIILLLMIGIFIAYATTLIQNSTPTALRMYLIRNKGGSFVLPLILMPVFMMWLRILTDIKNKFTSLKISGIIIGTSYGISIVLILLVNGLAYSKYTMEEYRPQLIQIENAEGHYNLSYSDRYIFGELIRTIEFSSDYEPVLVQITIEGQEAVPVLYSEYDYSFKTNKIAAVDIPVYPGKKIKFSYGSNGDKEIICSKVIFKTDRPNQKLSISKTIETEVVNAAK